MNVMRYITQMTECTYTPSDKKHEPMKRNFYSFGYELTPMALNIISPVPDHDGGRRK